MTHVVLGLGSNLGARRALFSCALRLLQAVDGLEVLGRSRLYHTPPLGPPQPDFLNGALLVQWSGSLPALLAHTQRIELLLRRTRAVHWGPRTLDIDILWSSEGALSQPGLHVPHRELHKRNFALAPLLDVVPTLHDALAESLAAAGGAPAQVEPWQPLFTRTAHGAETAACREPAELLSALASAACALFTDGDAADEAQPFTLPGGTLAQQCDSLMAQLEAYFAGGFRVCAAALTELGDGALHGVMVGQSGARQLAAPAFTYALRQHEGTTWATVRA